MEKGEFRGLGDWKGGSRSMTVATINGGGKRKPGKPEKGKKEKKTKGQTPIYNVCKVSHQVGKLDRNQPKGLG